MTDTLFHLSFKDKVEGLKNADSKKPYCSTNFFQARNMKDLKKW